MRILVVDDSRVMRNIIKNTVSSRQGVQVECLEAESGLDAWRVLENETVDILLLDWNMPGLDGLGLVKRLRAVPKYQKLPIIMITSETAKSSVIEAVKAGVNDYLTKPVSEKLLHSKIDRLFD